MSPDDPLMGMDSKCVNHHLPVIVVNANLSSNVNILVHDPFLVESESLKNVIGISNIPHPKHPTWRMEWNCTINLMQQHKCAERLSCILLDSPGFLERVSSPAEVRIPTDAAKLLSWCFTDRVIHQCVCRLSDGR